MIWLQSKISARAILSSEHDIPELRPEMPFEDLAVESGIAAPLGRDHLWEIYSPPRIGPVLRALGGRCKRSVDLGNFWNLADPGSQHCLLSDVLAMRPYMLMMGPPCTMFSMLVFSNWLRMERSEREARLAEACTFADVTAWLADLQIQVGDYFAIENPEGSQIWSRPNASLQQVLKLPSAIPWNNMTPLGNSCLASKVRDLPGECVVFDMCEFGMTCPRGRPIKKTTILKTNCQALADAFRDRKCQGMHEHIQISGSVDGKSLSKHAQVYPPLFCDTVAKAVLRQWDADHA